MNVLDLGPRPLGRARFFEAMNTYRYRRASRQDQDNTTQSSEKAGAETSTAPLHSDPKPLRLIPLEEVIQRTGMKRTSIYLMLKYNEFPSPVKILRSSRWAEHEVAAWIQAQMAKRVMAPRWP
jgi:prophage regulatory protein